MTMPPATSRSSETSPLLPPPPPPPPTSGAGNGNGDMTTLRRFAVAAPYVLVFLAFEVSIALVAIPMSPIQELIICRKHYPHATGADPRCKEELVQSEFSMLKGWEVTFALFPGMITAVPYGMAADRYGRRLVLGLSLLGLTLSQAADIVICCFPEVFPLRLIWLAATLTAIGGGPFVTVAMLFVIATDISTEAQRSITFLYLTAISLVGQLIAAPLTYVAMASGTWLAVFVGIGCLSVSTLAMFVTPETSGMRPLHDREQDVSADSNDNALSRVGLKTYVATTVENATASIRSVFWDDKKVGLLMLSFLFTSVGKNVPILLMQYATKRFHWSWAEAGLLNSVSAVVNLAAVALILPFATQLLLVNLGLSPLLKDLWLARVGILALTTGAFGLGLAPSSGMLVVALVVFSLGSGYSPAVRGLLVTVAEGRQTGLLFTTMSLLESIGLLISGPFLAETFKVGMAWGGVWVGLPFISAGYCLAFAALVLIGIRFHGGIASAC